MQISLLIGGVSQLFDEVNVVIWYVTNRAVLDTTIDDKTIIDLRVHIIYLIGL